MPSEIRSNCHTHTQRVDGRSTAREMTGQALKLGFVSLGFTEHAEEKYCGLTKEGAEAYINEINALKAEYAGRIKLWLGIERDRLSDDNRRDRYDYVLGASHYLTAPDGTVSSVDGDADEVETFVNTYLDGNWDRALEMYFSSSADYVAAYKPDIIAHLDVITKFNHKRHWFDEGRGTFIECGRAAMERMIRACNIMEVNTGGMARAGRPCPYPVLPLLSYWHELGGRVIVSSDCHFAPQLDAAFDTVGEYIKRSGFKTCLRLGTGTELFQEYML